MFGRNHEPRKYSEEWFRSLTDEELTAEKEAYMRGYMRGEFGTQWLADRFQREEKMRYAEKHKNDKPGSNTPSFHREHGYYLPNDD